MTATVDGRGDEPLDEAVPDEAVPDADSHADRQVLHGVARGGGFAALGSAAGAALGLVLTLVVTHSLSQTSAGQFFSTTAVFLVAQTLLAFGVGAGLVRFIPRYRALDRTHDVPTLLVVAAVPVLVAGLIGSVALWLLAGTLAHRLGGQDISDVTATYRVVALLFLPSTFEIAAVECTRAFGQLRRYVLLQQVGVPLLRPILVGLAAALSFPLWAVVAMWLVPLVVAMVLGLVSVARSLRALVGSSWPGLGGRSVPIGSIAREYWAFTAARGTAMVMDTLLTWLDVVLVASIVAPAQAAIYAAASRFITAGTLVLQALRLALAADISAALAQGRLDRVSQMYRSATQWVVLSSWPLYLVMAVFAPTVLRIFGGGYSGGSTAMSVLCLAMMVNLAAGNVGTVLLMGGKSTWVLYDKLACVALNVGLNLLLIPHFGITGAAVAWAVTILLDSTLSFSQVRWGMRVGGRLDGVALAGGLALVCFGLVALAGRFLLGQSIPAAVISAGVGAVLFAGPVIRWRSALGLDVLLGAIRPARTRS